MPSNYVLLEKITVGAEASSVTFSSIPQTGYTDLVIKASCRSTWNGSTTALALQFNSDGGSNYSYRRFYATGASVGMDSTATTKLLLGYVNGSNQAANTFSNTEIYIPNYTSSSVKSVSTDSVNEDNATTALSSLSGGLWSGTAAITSITLVPWDTPANFIGGTSFYLYGVAKLGTTPVITPYATGGDTIMTDGTYWYHAFKTSGTFTPQKSLSCDYLVVAGGGGGARWGGGGGAGGLRSTVTATGGGGSLETPLSLASGTGYTVTIGAGGLGGIGSTPLYQGNNGSNSVFSTITAVGGGGGGAYTDASVGKNGGSGGGGGGNGAKAGGTGTANQGYAGGTGQSGNYLSGGSGGGAGAPGNTGTNAGATGGAGVAISALATATQTGVSNYYAGGGGGAGQYTANGAGGAGGGGGTAVNSNGTAGTANTGGGGGGGHSQAGVADYNGGNGGSGIVIVRYAV